MARQRLPDREFEWSSDLAYLVGLIATDGCLSSDGRHIIFKSTDRYLPEVFKNILHLENAIVARSDGRENRKTYYVLQIGNVQLYRWLQKIGLFPNKTYTLGAIALPDKYFRDFLRGHLDGDGSIRTYLDNYSVYKSKRYFNTRVYTRFISASEDHIRWLYRKIYENASVTGALIYRKPSGHKVAMWEIKIAKYESLKLFSWLYYQENLPALERKRQIAQNVLGRVVNNKLVV